ncbi:multiheme c-type cytochrome [Polyangium sp. 6x1]|uniref:multiheme c-type cytochrome n=1 Tax=Polyangium sp. 6x1 TaxID=3042689 RepID=UPI002482AFDD|nr:multiheme c-type cytochrome [Polyangium sp. 6x1]MDI1451423.1 multiheme c-type cytochrome [Polyangium sp. 6x1]
MLRPSLLMSFGLLAGCVREDVLTDGQVTSAPAPPAAASPARAPADLAPAADMPAAPGVPMPRAYRKRLDAAVALNATCVACHADEAKQWQGSHHQQSNLNPAYRKAFAIEPTPFCRGCHAPEGDPAVEPPKAVSELGVGCVTCHVTEEGLVLAAASPGADAARAPHPLRRSTAFSQTGGCAGCHEFRFPMGFGNDDGQFMQTTAREHQRSPAAGKACADCHMPRVEGRRSHAFAEVRDPVWLRSNLQATAERAGDDTLRVTLVQPAPGHDFPTGDLFRRLEVGCELKDESGAVLRREVRHLARHFQIVPGQPGRHLAADDRVGRDPKVVEFDITPPGPAPRRATVSWWVRYQRVATVGTGTNPADAKIESEVLLHSGEIP